MATIIDNEENWFNKIGGFLTSLGMKFIPHNEHPIYLLNFSGVNTTLRFSLLCSTNSCAGEDFLLIKGYLPHVIAEKDKLDTLNFLNEQSEEIALGSYHIESDPYRIYIKIGAEVWPTFTAEQLQSLLFLGAAALDDVDVAWERKKRDP